MVAEGDKMKYLMKYCDASSHVMMKEIIESNESVESVLRKSCEKKLKLRRNLFDRLRQEISWIGQSNVRYRIVGREGILYYIDEAGKEQIVEISICSPVGFTFRRRDARPSGQR